MKKVLFVCPPGHSPVRQYRGEGVMDRLAKVSDIHLVHPRGKEAWLDLLSVNVAYFMRQTFPQDVNLASMAKDMKVPVWYDMDDDYLAVPQENPAHDSYQQENTREVIFWFVQNADVMTVSTVTLLEKYSKMRPNKPTILLPNAIDDYIFKDYWTFPGKAKSLTMAWRGGVSHQGDLLDYADDFWEFLEQKKEWDLHFLGYNPFWIAKGFPWLPKEYSGRCFCRPYDYGFYSYMRELRGFGSFGHIVPLKDNPFNRAKSSIAAIEALYAGSLLLVPNWVEWDLPGAFRYSNKAEFRERMLEMTKATPDIRQALWEKNVEWVRVNRSLSRVNERRVQIVRWLCGEGDLE